MIMKVLSGGAIVVGVAVGLSGTATADPPSPFGSLGCSCQETAPAGSPALTQKIDRGIRQGLSGLPSSPVFDQ
ncbi:hypothetical protein [Mycobacterium parmense]|uniref:Uncharacterized protein n=1 Tax=Mycobacterium parmense TaxID=185642 RepID=A0A7I7YUR1_9MYCO|nr:hypothetical protein [Mycobacterium parmense]MCV7350954.1 hypothetical protein [Mycobacterium parmense]ORW53527.1 hypothetical protein AWC20_19930 [Mycobacterium parmense]BBZ45608.1 hypothetical protein MPRM_28890 [Mycobacterium parmense]